MDLSDTPEDWTDEQRDLFSKVCRYITSNQDAFCHPAMPRISSEHFATIAWNAAFIAAELSTGDDVRIIDADTQATIAEMPGNLNS